ncbi:unnamed protein product [Protopolystoma xenopodis]|uniref:Uncharacterized protein n=1 Tax=Protopolystoma xenopodis TaxID=117903 RepID=A0A448X997_9PLAT|nr:unnamed protein product [Protopolystoma xenopodis]
MAESQKPHPSPPSKTHSLTPPSCPTAPGPANWPFGPLIAQPHSLFGPPTGGVHVKRLPRCYEA